MIGALVLRLGLPVILSIFGVAGGFGANWWFGITDWQTALIFAAALIGCVYVSTSNSPFSRLGVAAILMAAGYLKGGVDKEHDLHEAFDAKILALHQKYKDQSDREIAREKRANDDALAALAQDKKKFDDDLQSLKAENEKLISEAAKDKFALRPGLSPDAVDRLNKQRLRGGPGS